MHSRRYYFDPDLIVVGARRVFGKRHLVGDSGIRVTAARASEILGLHVRYVRKQLVDGKLMGSKEDGRWMISLDALGCYLLTPSERTWTAQELAILRGGGIPPGRSKRAAWHRRKRLKEVETCFAH